MKIADYRYKFHATVLTEEMIRPYKRHFDSENKYYGFLYLSDSAFNANYRICEFFSLDSTFHTVFISNQVIALPIDAQLDLSIEAFAPLKVRAFTYTDNVVQRYDPSDPVAASYMFNNPLNILDFLEP